MPEPTIDEIVRRIEAVVKTVEKVSATMESSYVRKDVYEPNAAAVRQQVLDLVRAAEAHSVRVETAYVKRELYETRHEALRKDLDRSINEVTRMVEATNREIAEINRIREKDSDRWKQFMLALAVQFIVILVVGGIGVSNFVARGGG